MSSLISIIVPIYNIEKYLTECIDSIINQSYSNIEIILVDDGSTDKCGKICDDYAKKDERIRVIHKKNGGQGSARNVALDICSGEYIVFVDSDDYIKNNMIEVLYTTIVKEKADIVSCEVIFDNGIRKNESARCNKLKRFSNYELMKEYLWTTNIRSVLWDKIYSRHIFTNIRFPEIRKREDAYVMHEILGLCRKYVSLPQSLYVQFIRPGSTEQSRFSVDNLIDLDIAKRKQKYIKTNYPDLYYLIKYDLVKAIQHSLERICKDFCYMKYKEIYIELEEMLKKELSLFEKSMDDDGIPSEIADSINHPKKFIAISHYKGLKRHIKQYVKSVFLRFR